MSKYPQEFPSVEATHLYEMVTNGTLADNLAHASHDAWWISGYLMKFTIGEPDNHGAAPTEASAAEEFNNALVPIQKAQLQNLSCLAGLTPEDLTQPGADPEGILKNIDWKNLMTNIQYIIQALQLLKLI
jgi:hypothetical protein